MATVSDVAVTIRADTQDFNRNVAGAQESTRRFSVSMSDLAAAAQVAAGGVVLMGRKITAAMTGLRGVFLRGTAAVLSFAGVGLSLASGGLARYAESTRQANGEMTTTGRVASVASQALKAYSLYLTLTNTALLAVAAGALTLTPALLAANKAFNAASESTDTWNRVRTLLQGASADATQLRGQVSDMAAALGISANDANKAMYEMFSAMPELVNKPAEAMQVLQVALEAASTGFVDAGGAVTLITGLLNTYGLQASEARRVSDMLFATQDAGKTTFDQLANSLGTVAPLAASMGLSLQDLLGVIATMTPQLVETGVSASNLRAVFANVLNPSEDAKAAAFEMRTEFQKAGISFDAAGLKAAGLVPWLRKMVEITKGNPEILARFFGSVEAQGFMTNVAGQLDKMATATDSVGRSVGSTTAKVAVMNENWEKQKAILNELVKSAWAELGYGMESAGAVGLRAVNALITAYLRLDGVVDRAYSRMMGKVIGPQSALGDMFAWLKEMQSQQMYRPAASAPARPAAAPSEPATLDFAQRKIAEQKTSLEAAAKLQYDRTKDYAAYTAQMERARAAVNRLTVAEMDRLRKAGASKAQLDQLAASYDVGSKPKGNDEAARKAKQRYDEDQRLIEQALARNQSAFDKQAASLREMADAAQRRGRAGLAVTLRAEADQVDRLGASARALAPAAGAVLNQFEELGEATIPLARLVSAYEQATLKIREQTAAGLIDKDAAEQQGREAARALNAGIRAVLQDERAKGALSTAAEAGIIGLLNSDGAPATALEQIAPQLKQIEDAYALTMARIREDVARGVLSPERAAEQGRMAAVAFNAQAMGLLDELRAAGKITADVYKEIVGKLQTPDRADDLSKKVGEYADLARAVGTVGESLGIIGENAKKALDSVALLAESIQRLRALQASGQSLMSLPGVTGVIGAVSAAVSIAAGIGKALFGKSPQEKERDALLKTNNEELRKLALEISGFRVTMSTRSEAAKALPQLASDQGRRDILFGTFGKSAAGQAAWLNEYLKQFGLTWDQLLKIAEESGVKIVDSQGKIVVGALGQLAQALALSTKALLQFGTGLDDQKKKQDAANQIYDREDTPQRALEDQIALLQKFAPELSKQYGLDKADTSTAEGRAQIEAAIRAIFEAMQAGTLTAGQLGGFKNIDELLSVILGADGALDRFADATNKATASMTNVPEGFRVFNAQIARFNATAAGAVAPPTSGPRVNPLAAAGATVNSSVMVAEGAIQVRESKSPRETAREVVRLLKAELARQADPLGLRDALPEVA